MKIFCANLRISRSFLTESEADFGGQCPIGVKLTLKPTCSVRSRMFIEKGNSDSSPIGAT